MYHLFTRDSNSYSGVVTSSPEWPTSDAKDCSFKLYGSKRGYKIVVMDMTFYGSRYCPSDVEKLTFTGE